MGGEPPLWSSAAMNPLPPSIFAFMSSKCICTYLLVGSAAHPAARLWEERRARRPRSSGARHSPRRAPQSFQVLRGFGSGRSENGGFREPARSDLQVVSTGSAENRSEEQTSELQALMRISYAGCCLKKK